MSTVPLRAPEIGQLEDTEQTAELERLHRVLVHNDDVTPYDFVLVVLVRFFGLQAADAEQVTWTSPAYQPDCAGCHANDFISGPHKKHENPDVSYTVAEISDCTGACHIYTDSTLSTVKEFRPGPEHRVSAGDF